MGTKMDAEEILIYKKIEDILWFDWDPIGINQFLEARDEYQCYLPVIYNLKKTGADVEIIAQTLNKFETVNIGISGSLERCTKVAKKIRLLFKLKFKVDSGAAA
jgi:hypothetical protein